MLIKAQDFMKGMMDRNVDIKEFSEEVSDGNEKQFCGNWQS